MDWENCAQNRGLSAPIRGKIGHRGDDGADRAQGRTPGGGAKQTRRAVNDGRALRVFLAKDADPNVTAPIEELCAQRQVSVEWADAMREVGAACGIAVGAAVAALVRE